MTRSPRGVAFAARLVPAGLDILSLRQPTLVSTRIDVDSDALESMLASTASATVTCHAHQPEPPLDATIFELTFGDELNETRYRWAGQAPVGWAPLATFASRLMDLVDAPASAGAAAGAR
jgi:hypothetical protein